MCALLVWLPDSIWLLVTVMQNAGLGWFSSDPDPSRFFLAETTEKGHSYARKSMAGIPCFQELQLPSLNHGTR